MAGLPVRMLTQEHDLYLPLALGEVTIPGVDLRLRRVRVGTMAGMLERIYDDPEVDIGEASFVRYISRIAEGNRSVVALPAFVVRSFRHRAIYIRRDSKLSLADLRGRTIGISEWRATGNTWARAVLSDAGVRTQDCRWILAQTDSTKKPPPRDELPNNASYGGKSDTLVDLLVAGEVDAVIAALEPRTLYDPNCPFMRLFQDYRASEREYCHRTGIFPGHHIICVKREFYERHRRETRAVYDGLDEAKLSWDRYSKFFGQSSPWLLWDLEQAQGLMGEDWRPFGIERNRAMITALCAELFEQGLVPRRVDPSELFPEFESGL